MKNENGIEKSAILSGQTLVNSWKKHNTYSPDNFTFHDDGFMELNKPVLYFDHIQTDSSLLKPNTKYLLIIEAKNNTLPVETHFHPDSRTVFSGVERTVLFAPKENGVRKVILTSNSDFSTTTNDLRWGVYISFLQVNMPENERGTMSVRQMLIEYQEGMENWDIPYFEGMQSVKMPVLTTIGKNLFEDNTVIQGYYNGSDIFYNDSKFITYENPISVIPNTKYIFGNNIQTKYGRVNFYDKNMRIISSIADQNLSPFTTPSNCYFVRFSTYRNTGIIPSEITWSQLEVGGIATSYEPFKSNILSTPEDLELRVIGDVKDELNVATGEVVERIGEVFSNSLQASFALSIGTYANVILVNYPVNFLGWENRNLICDKLKTINRANVNWDKTSSINGISLSPSGFWFIVDKTITTREQANEYLNNLNATIQYELPTPIVKTVDLTIQDQDNQSQERMKIYPSGYINTSSLTFPPILELKGIAHNNKLNMTTTNGTNNTQLATLDNLALDGIVCREGTVVRDSYDVESGLYTKRVFRFTIDEEFVERYRNVWVVTKNDKIVQLSVLKQYTNLPNSVAGKGSNNNIPYVDANTQCCFLVANAGLYIKIFLEEMSTYDVDGLLDWIKRNGNIEVAYQMATPQIVHMQPNMNPYVSTRPYQGSIESQGNILESSFLDYTSEQSIISPKPLGDGDVLRWEQGSQCYVYENDKEYIPLTDYNQPMGTVLDLEEEDGEQFIENLDGGDIIVDVPFKEKAVYERHLVPHEDKVIYPTQDKLDTTGKIEVDYICGETWQNPDDLSDIRHVGTLREDGQYDVTIRRSSDDEIRLMNGTTHLSLDGDGLNPSEFELTFLNSGGVEVGKYGDTSHTLEDCVFDSKLETGTVYGNTEVVNEVVNSTIVNGFTTTGKNLFDKTYQYNNTEHRVGVYMDTVDVNTFRINGMVTTPGDVDFYGKSYNDMMVCKPNTTYYAKAFIVSGSYTNAKNLVLEDRVGFRFTDELGESISWAIKKATTSSVQNRLSRVRFSFYVDEKWVFDNLVVQIMLIEGDTAPVEFEPWHSIQHTLPTPITLNKIGDVVDTYDVVSGIETRRINPETLEVLATSQTIQHTLIPSTVETMQEPTFILPQPLRSVPNGICDRLYWDENKGHYCIEKRIGVEVFDGVNNFNLDVTDGQLRNRFDLPLNNIFYINDATLFYYTNSNIFPQLTYNEEYNEKQGLALYNNGNVYFRYSSNISNAQFKQLLIDNPVYIYYALNTSEIIDLPHLNKKLTLPTHPNTLPIGHKVEHSNANPQLGLTIPYKQLNYPSRPQNIDFRMDIADYVLTWDDVKEARQYNIILNDRVIATVKEPQWNSGEEMYGYIMVEAQNELAENLSEELYIKTVPNAPAQLTVGHNPMTDYYDFEISFIKTSAIAEYYTVQYRIDGGEWVYKTIQSDEIDPNSKVLWRFSVYEINEQIEVWATATNEIGTNDILPIATYYMSPTPQWTYRISSKELFVRWMDDSPYDTQYKLRYQYKSDGIYRYAYFEGDKQEIGKLYEALIPLADDEEVSIALCIISEKENLYTKPIKASKELDPNIKPPRNFNYHWLARGLIEFYWEDNYDVDVEYEAIIEHRLTSGSNEWITDTRIFSATDTEGTGTIYRLSYQMEDLEEIRVRVRMRWAMNETEWSESLTTVFIPVEGNPPQWIRRTQTQEGLLVEWEAQEYVDSYHVYVMSNGEELQHLETMDNFIYVDLDYSNPIDIEIYETTRFSGGIQSDPSDKMCFRPTMDKQQMIYNVVTPDTLTYKIEVNTIQKAIKERQQIHDINTTPGVKTKEPMDVAIKSPFTLSYHPLRLDVHQAGAKYYGDTELHIKTLDVKSRDVIEVLSFERVTDQYGVDFTVYTPSASKYPITLEVNRVRIVCFGDSLTSGHPGFWAETGTGDPQHCYEYWLDRRLKGQYEIINKGYGSDTTDRMLARFDKDVLSNNPQYCIIQGGTNDLYWAMAESMGDQEALNMKLDVMKANIMEMVKRCWDNNIIPIVGNLIPRTGATGIYKTALYDFNAWIISWCTGQASLGRNIFYVDLFNAGKEAVPPTPIEDPTNPGAMNPIYDGDALFDEFGNIIKQGRGIHLNKEGYKIWAEAIPLSIFKTYDSGLRMYKDLHCTDEDIYDDSDKQNPFYTISIDNVRRSKTKTVVRYVKNIGKTQVLFAMYASDEYNMSIEFVGSDGEKGAYANGLLAPNMIAKVTMEINLDNRDSKANFNLHLAAREYNQN